MEGPPALLPDSTRLHSADKSHSPAIEQACMKRNVPAPPPAKIKAIEALIWASKSPLGPRTLARRRLAIPDVNFYLPLRKKDPGRVLANLYHSESPTALRRLSTPHSTPPESPKQTIVEMAPLYYVRDDESAPAPAPSASESESGTHHIPAWVGYAGIFVLALFASVLIFLVYRLIARRAKGAINTKSQGVPYKPKGPTSMLFVRQKDIPWPVLATPAPVHTATADNAAPGTEDVVFRALRPRGKTLKNARRAVQVFEKPLLLQL
ncbi:hypothetical protein B0H17DRAFT_1142223 [Mycena rosella]|uniref:Uncharacterized protein n=1 Tax=Mycena rosella TaxID=1033263 RepID=A0AAD7G870_MYCRO|nr:hypothetical protein B0H17DRAFT_1142223 [Mycena rosella]